MTRRIAITILLTVWAAIVVAGVAAWFTARAVMLADLDGSIVQRAMALPAVADPAAGPPPAFRGDRYVVKGQLGQTIGRQSWPERAGAVPQVVDASFVQLPEGRFRRLTLKLNDERAKPPVTVIYSTPAAEFDRVLRQLAISLGLCGAIAGGAAALAAARLARLALRPLSRAADVIGTIDEAHLDRRIDQHPLPVELRPMTSRLNELLERLQQAFEQRRRFLADASHELRTPVAAMITTMEVALRRPRSAAELEQTLQTCLSEAGHLRQLVQALLRQVRAEGNLSPGQIQTFDAAKMIDQCAQLTQSMAGERRVRVLLRVGGIVPVRAEPDRLRSAVLNLISNAIEYNHPGGTVEVSAGTENGSAEIVVKDDGPGIPPEHLPHLFQPFYRANPGQNSDAHLGLGLFLVDSHVKAMGGECRVESTVGAGTAFFIRLPSLPSPTPNNAE